MVGDSSVLLFRYSSIINDYYLLYQTVPQEEIGVDAQSNPIKYPTQISIFGQRYQDRDFARSLAAQADVGSLKDQKSHCVRHSPPCGMMERSELVDIAMMDIRTLTE